MTPVLPAGVLDGGRKLFGAPGLGRAVPPRVLLARLLLPPARLPAAPTGCGAAGAGPSAGDWGGSRLPERPPGSAAALPRSGIAAWALPAVRARCLPCFPAAQPALLPWLPAF